MKPFDIELAKAGHPVCTRDGRAVRIICFDRKNTNGCSIIALVDKGEYEECLSFVINGKFYNDERGSDNDLFMATLKKEGWINIYKDGDRAMIQSCNIYQSKEDAVDMHSPISYITTVKIEWEE